MSKFIEICQILTIIALCGKLALLLCLCFCFVSLFLSEGRGVYERQRVTGKSDCAKMVFVSSASVPTEIQSWNAGSKKSLLSAITTTLLHFRLSTFMA